MVNKKLQTNQRYYTPKIIFVSRKTKTNNKAHWSLKKKKNKNKNIPSDTKIKHALRERKGEKGVQIPEGGQNPWRGGEGKWEKRV